MERKNAIIGILTKKLFLSTVTFFRLLRFIDFDYNLFSM